MSPPRDDDAKPYWSRSFYQVLAEELDVVGEEIEGTPTAPGEAGNLEDQIARAHRKQLVGLAFSGGGIRSATFNLGVLQALAQMRLLSRFDYLSTVSGGGYIGSWLMAWTKRRGLKDVEKRLNPEWVEQPRQAEPTEISDLRRFSNDLPARLGWLGPDMSTFVTIYARNLVLNLMVLVAGISVLLLLPRGVAIGSLEGWHHGSYRGWAAAAITAVSFAIMVITRSLFFFRRGGIHDREPTMTAKDYEKRDMLPLLAGDQLSRWRDDEGQRLSDPVAHAVLKSNVWFDQPFDDFVLAAKFSLAPTAESGILVWQNRGPTAPGGETAVGGHLIDLGQTQFHLDGDGGARRTRRAGAIDDHEPSRSVQLNLENNSIEVMCVKGVITVTLNGLTINRQRVTGSAAAKNSAKPGLIGLRHAKGVIFKEVYVKPLPSTLDRGGTQGQIQRFIVLPLFIAALIGIFVLFFGDFPAAIGEKPMRQWLEPGIAPIHPWSWNKCALLAAALSGGLVLLARLTMVIVEWIRTLASGGKFSLFSRRFLGSIVREALCLAGASLVGGYALRGLYELFVGRTLWEVMTWGTPALVGVFTLILTLHISLLGRILSDRVSAWWSRLVTLLMISSFLWVAVFGTAFYFSAVVNYLGRTSLSIGWVASTVWGVVAARSASSLGPRSRKIRDLIVQIAPYIFIIGLFLFLSLGIDLLVGLIAPPDRLPEIASPNFSAVLRSHWFRMDQSNTWFSVGIVALGALVVAAIFSWRLDINQFSMHPVYRDRLARCYLGTSNAFRDEQSFTGYSVADDFDLWELEDFIKVRPDANGTPHMTAPYLIINATLGRIGGHDLPWQQRTASFILTQKYCGYDVPALPASYSPTVNYITSGSRLNLSTAMAISGATARPRMAQDASAASALLMTIFNTRQFWWLAKTSDSWRRSRTPTAPNLISAFLDLFGLTSATEKYFYLSDGGYFENLGIYELVRRRCRFIVACDAEEDPSLSFGDLGNAIEKCRADFGIDIEIDVGPIRRRNEQGRSASHCAVGRIRYSQADGNRRDGILVYIKSSLTGDEPTDILRYAAENPEFPCQSTSQKWFGESQFESYRALGLHVTQSVFSPVAQPERIADLTKEQLFVNLAQRWYPPTALARDSFTKHTSTLSEIYDALRTNEDLSFLSEQIHPEWRVMLSSEAQSELGAVKQLPLVRKLPASGLPKMSQQVRAAFYLSNSMLHLMEDVYVDLHLEEEFDHPDNRGWINMFRHWSRAPIFRIAWTISASRYGARFQNFCERQLDMAIGATKVEEIEIDSAPLSSQWPPETGRLSRAIAETIWRWLITLSLDPEARSRAVATAAAYPGVHPEYSEEEALEIARRAILEALEVKEKERVIPQPDGATNEHAAWVAAATLLEMIRRNVGKAYREKYENRVVQYVLLYSATIAKRFSTDQIRERLNATERELIELFFIYNPKLAQSGRIIQFRLTPNLPFASMRSSGAALRSDSAGSVSLVEGKTDHDLNVPFGFAIVATIGDHERLVYFRVQDHLRKMGLGRQALECLIRMNMSRGRELGVTLYEMHPHAQEMPSHEDRLRFLMLFDSAKTAVQQNSVWQAEYAR